MTENAAPDVSSQTNFSEQTDSGEINVAQDSQEHDSNVMGEAVREVQKKTQAHQKQTSQYVEVGGKRYTPAQIEAQLKQVENYKKGMHDAFNQLDKVRKSVPQQKPQNPFEAMRQAGYSQEDIDRAFQEYANYQVKWSQMTPEQREAESIRRQNLQYRQQLEQLHKQQQQAQHEAMTEYMVQQYDNAFKTHIEQTGLPYTQLEMREMAQLIEGNLKKGVAIDWEEAAEQLRHNRQSSIQNWMKDVLQSDPTGNLLVKHLPKEVYEAIRKHSVQKVRQVAQAKSSSQQQTAPPPPKADKMTPAEWRQYIKTIN